MLQLIIQRFRDLFGFQPSSKANIEHSTHKFSEGKSTIDINTPEANLVGWVASASAINEVFRQRAIEAAGQLNHQQIEDLPLYFYYPNNPHKPKEAKDKFTGLGDWQFASQIAIFEIFYNRPEISLPLIRKYAFGEYDWTQTHAIYVLCRLAADGIIDPEKTVNELIAFFPRMTYETEHTTIDKLSLIKPAPPNLVQFIKERIEKDETIDQAGIDLGTLIALVRVAPEEAKIYRSALEDKINGKFELESNQKVPSFEQLQAMVVVSMIYPEELEIHSTLLNWMKNHPDATIRRGLKIAISELPYIQFNNRENDE